MYRDSKEQYNADCLARLGLGVGLRLGLVLWSGLALKQAGW